MRAVSSSVLSAPVGPGGATMNTDSRNWRPSANPRYPPRHTQVQNLRDKLEAIRENQRKLIASRPLSAPNQPGLSRSGLSSAEDPFRGPSSSHGPGFKMTKTARLGSYTQDENMTPSKRLAMSQNRQRDQAAGYFEGQNMSLYASPGAESFDDRIAARQLGSLSSRVPMGRLPRSKPWVPAGALHQSQPSVSWHRQPSMQPSLTRSSGPFLKLRPDPEAPDQQSEMITREGELRQTHKAALKSEFWTVVHPRDQGQADKLVTFLDPIGKFEIQGKAQVNYAEKLPGAHTIRFMFRISPPASEIDTTIQASSGEEDVPGFRAWALRILSNGCVAITWSTCGLQKSERGVSDGRNPGAQSRVEQVILGHVGIGKWYVAQLVIAAGNSFGDFSVDIWAIPAQNPAKPAEVPAVGRQLKGCKRVYWHHVRLLAAQSSQKLIDSDARLRPRMWHLLVRAQGGLLEFDMWRIEPKRDKAGGSAMGAARSRGRMGGRSDELRLEEGDDTSHTMREVVMPEIGDELDAHTIAANWGVEKVQAFLSTFRDEFGDVTDEYKAIFRAEAVDGATLLGLTADDLEGMGMRRPEHRLLLLKEIESHLLSCGSRALAAPTRVGTGASDESYPGARAQGRVDPVRALLESLRVDFGDAKATEYHKMLRNGGVETHAQLLALDDNKLRSCGVATLSHRKMLLSRVETLKLLASPEEKLAQWAREGAGKDAALHSLLGAFSMDHAPPLAQVPPPEDGVPAQEFREIEKFFWQWCCNPESGTGGEEITIDGIHRTIMPSRQLERFRDARAQLRNPFAPLLRLFLTGLNRQQMLQACSADGLQLPPKPGEYGKGLDFVGALRPACVKPWAFPQGTHTLLICDVAVGIPWRLPDEAVVFGEWNEWAGGVATSRLTDWSISRTNCDLMSPEGWLRITSGGSAQAAERVCQDQVLCFSVRVCSTDLRQPQVAEPYRGRQSGQGLRAYCGIERGEYGTPLFARFGLAVVNSGSNDGAQSQAGECSLLLVRESSSTHRTSRAAETWEQEREELELGQLQQGLWYSVEMRVTQEKIAGKDMECVRVDVFAGRGGVGGPPLGGSGSGSGNTGRNEVICSHQSMIDDSIGDDLGWTPSVQVLGHGILEFDDWVLRRGPLPAPGKDVMPAYVPADSDGEEDNAQEAVSQLSKKQIIHRLRPLLLPHLHKIGASWQDARRLLDTLVTDDLRRGLDSEIVEPFVKKLVNLDRVRSAGYDSIFIPRMVSALDGDKLERFCTKLRNMTSAQASSESIESSLRQILLTLGKEADAGKSGTNGGKGTDASKGKGGEDAKPAKCYREGGASMGCRCSACVDDIKEAARQHRNWEKEHLPVFKTLPPHVQKEYNPISYDHFDHYVVYNADQALPRYLITFTVKEKEPPTPPEPEDCWMCGSDTKTPSQTTVLLHFRDEPVPMCFACAAKSSVPAAPELVAPATEEMLDSKGLRALVLQWSEPTCPAPIDMYLLQAAALPEGSEDPEDAHPWKDIFSDFALRTLKISPAVPKPDPLPDMHGAQGVEKAEKAAKAAGDDGVRLAPGPYCFRVRARSSAGWGDWSKQVYRKVHSAQATGRRGRHETRHKLLVDADLWAASSTAVLNDAPLSPRLPSPASGESDDEGGELEQATPKDATERPVGTISASSRVQYCAAWHPRSKELWLKASATSNEVLVHDSRGRLLRSEHLPCQAICLSFAYDGSLYAGSGLDFFAKLDSRLAIVWKVTYTDGPCARGITAEPRKRADGGFDSDRVYASFNSGPILELDADTGAKLRVIAVKPGFSMALSLASVCPDVLAVSDSGRIFLVSTKDGSWLKQVAAGYLNAALAFDGSRLLVGPANSQVWHLFKLSPPYDSPGHPLVLS